MVALKSSIYKEIVDAIIRWNEVLRGLSLQIPQMT